MKVLSRFTDISNRKVRIILWIISFILYFSIFYHIQKFTDSSLLYGDEWEYQSIAVNFANGLGFPQHGCLLNFEDYHFYEGSNDYAAIYTKQNSFDLYRTPVYMLFTGLIYIVFGVHPYTVKLIQLILYIIISCSLPWIGWKYWKKKGYIAGTITGILYLALNFQYAGSILTEPIVSFISFLIIICYTYFEFKRTIFSSCCLGLILGLSWLTKGILMPIAGFVLLLLLIRYFKVKTKQSIRLFVITCLFFVIPIAIYSAYINTRSNKFVLISTQGEAILLDSHNEYMKNGFWAPDWRQYSSSFYNNDHKNGQSAVGRVLYFYMNNPNMVIKLAKEKIVTGFFIYHSVWLIVLLLFFENLSIILNRFLTSKTTQRIKGIAISFLLLFSFAFIVWIIADNVYFISDKLLLFIVFLNKYLFWLLIPLIILMIYNSRKPGIFKIPSIFTIILLSFLTMVVLTCLPIRELRFIKVIDFIMLFIAVIYCIHFFEDLFPTNSNKSIIH